MAFSKVSKPINADENFWELNPWLKIHPPYSRLLKKHGEELSSRYMIAIFLMCDPDEEANPFFRMDEEYRKKTIAANYIKIDWEDKLIAECLESYPFDCMDSVERSFKEEKEKLKERAKFMKSMSYKLDLPESTDDEFDKEVFAAQLKVIDLMEKMAKNTDAIYKQYEKVEDKFIKGKTSAVVRGGRRLTRAEKREV